MASVGDEPQRIPDLLLVKMAERTFLPHAAIHFVRFSRARGAAEMPNEANVAPLNVFDFRPGQGEETSAASAGGNIAHQPAGAWRENCDQDVGEIGDHELAPGFAVKFMGPLQGGEASARDESIRPRSKRRL